MGPMVLWSCTEMRKGRDGVVRYCTHIQQKGLRRCEELLALVSVMLSVVNTCLSLFCNNKELHKLCRLGSISLLPKSAFCEII